MSATTHDKTPTKERADGQYPRSARNYLLAATSLGFAVVQLDVSVVNVAVKPIIGVALFGSLVAGPGPLVSGLHVALLIATALVVGVGVLARGIDN